MTNKQIAVELYRLAALPLTNEARFVATFGTFTVRCDNARPDIERMAAKFHKGGNFKTRQPSVSNPCRGESAKAIYKRYLNDTDSVQFGKLLGLIK